MLAECSCFIPVLPYSMCGAAKAMGSGCGAAPAHTAPAGFPELSECRFLSVRKGTGSGSLMQSDTPGCLKAQQAAENAVMGGERRGTCPPWGCFGVALGGSKLCSWAEPFPQASGCLRFKLQALNREAFFFFLHAALQEARMEGVRTSCAAGDFPTGFAAGHGVLCVVGCSSLSACSPPSHRPPQADLGLSGLGEQSCGGSGRRQPAGYFYPPQPAALANGAMKY